MLNDAVSAWLRRVGGRPGFRVYGRASYEPDWHLIDVYVTGRRDRTSRWPLWAGTCITWTANVIAVGRDFAAQLLREQGADDVFVFGGGIIPREDIPKLKEKGIEEIFTPGAPTGSIVEWLRARLAKKAS